MKAKKQPQTLQASSGKMALVPKYFPDNAIKHPASMIEHLYWK
jgi:hypothetical protein